MQSIIILQCDAKSNLKRVLSSLAYRYFMIDIQSVITPSGFFTYARDKWLVDDASDHGLGQSLET